MACAISPSACRSELQPLYLQQIGGLSLAQIGLLGSFFSGAMMLTPILSGKLADRYGERVPISAGFLVIFGGILVFLLADGYPAFILSWVLSGSGSGAAQPGVPEPGFKSGAEQLAGGVQRGVLQQRGLPRAARSLDWGAALGALRPAPALLHHHGGVRPDGHPHLAQVQAAR